jgi:hypothetical protein
MIILDLSSNYLTFELVCLIHSNLQSNFFIKSLKRFLISIFFTPFYKSTNKIAQINKTDEEKVIFTV